VARKNYRQAAADIAFKLSREMEDFTKIAP
jgi:hypothetical protein